MSTRSKVAAWGSTSSRACSAAFFSAFSMMGAVTPLVKDSSAAITRQMMVSTAMGITKSLRTLDSFMTEHLPTVYSGSI